MSSVTARDPMSLAQNILAQLMQLPRKQMDAELEKLKAENPTLHALVVAELRRFRKGVDPEME